MSLTTVKASDLTDDTILYKTTVNSVDVIISKSISEMKTLLGVPQKILVGKASSINIAEVGIVDGNVTKNIDGFSTSESAEFDWGRASEGVWDLDIPSAYDLLDGNTIANVNVATFPSGFTYLITYSNNAVHINIYDSGVLADIPEDESLSIVFEVKVFE